MSGAYIGPMFAAEFEPAPKGVHRDSPRARVAPDAELDKGGLGRALCKVVDISLYGARLATYTALARGSTILLTLPGIGLVVADIRWANDFEAGCHFRKALTEPQLEQLVGL